MKKIITTAVFLVFSTIQAHALDLSVFSLTGGLAHSQGVFGATAKETNLTDTGTAGHIKKESGVFTESFGSQFIEIGIGQYVSFGYEITPDAISTPTNTSRHSKLYTVQGDAMANGNNELNVSVDFNDLNTTYAKINIPGGMYLKAGYVETDLDIKETRAAAGGNTYANVSTEGTMLGLGYQRFLGETGFGIRFETSYLQLDPVTTNNGASTASASNGGLNTIDANHIEGVQAKVAFTYTLSRNN